MSPRRRDCADHRRHRRGRGLLRLGFLAGSIAATAAMAGVLIFDTLPGLVIGMAVSLLLLVYRASRPSVSVLGRTGDGRWVDSTRHPDAIGPPGVVVLRPEGGLYFANADNVRRRGVDAATGSSKAVAIDAEAVPALDVTAAKMLTDPATGPRRPRHRPRPRPRRRPRPRHPDPRRPVVG